MFPLFILGAVISTVLCLDDDEQSSTHDDNRSEQRSRARAHQNADIEAQKEQENSKSVYNKRLALRHELNTQLSEQQLRSMSDADFKKSLLKGPVYQKLNSAEQELKKSISALESLNI